jgi:hypothetical protein
MVVMHTAGGSYVNGQFLSKGRKRVLENGDLIGVLYHPKNTSELQLGCASQIFFFFESLLYLQLIFHHSWWGNTRFLSLIFSAFLKNLLLEQSTKQSRKHTRKKLMSEI